MHEACLMALDNWCKIGSCSNAYLESMVSQSRSLCSRQVPPLEDVPLEFPHGGLVVHQPQFLGGGTRAQSCPLTTSHIHQQVLDSICVHFSCRLSNDALHHYEDVSCIRFYVFPAMADALAAISPAPPPRRKRSHVSVDVSSDGRSSHHGEDGKEQEQERCAHPPAVIQRNAVPLRMFEDEM